MKTGKNFVHLLAGHQRVVARVYFFEEYFRFMSSQYEGKLEVLCEDFERLGTASLDVQFNGSWKEHAKKKVKVYSEMWLQKDKVLDRRYRKCSKSLKNGETGGNNGLAGELFRYLHW